ncbi:hypothetical protein PGH42_04805 [Legionella pneumophila]|nr:hypothetical protein PGH42_04805 [Legionella pneumophila]
MERFIFKGTSLLKLVLAFSLLIVALILVTPANAKAVNRDINPIINKANPTQMAYWVRYRYWGPRYYRGTITGHIIIVGVTLITDLTTGPTTDLITIIAGR